MVFNYIRVFIKGSIKHVKPGIKKESVSVLKTEAQQFVCFNNLALIKFYQ